MKLAIYTVKSFLDLHRTASEMDKPIIANKFVTNELPIVLEEMVKAQLELDQASMKRRNSDESRSD